MPRKTGVRGRYAGRFKRSRRKVSNNSYNLYGSTLRLETSGQINAAQCQYLGQSTIAVRKLLDAICRCIVKELMRQHGRSIMTWEEQWETTPEFSNQAWAIGYEYFTTSLTISPDEDPQTTYRQIVIAPTNTFQAIAAALATDIHDHLNSREPHEFVYFRLSKFTTGEDMNDITAKIYMNHFKVTVNGVSIMKIQNTTEARVVTDEDDEPDDSADKITSNPLDYKQYDLGRGNGFKYRYKRYLANTVAFGFMADEDTGTIQYDPADHSFTQLYKPPQPYAFGLGKLGKSVTKSRGNSGVLQPGDVKRSLIASTKTYSFNGLMNMLADTFGNTGNYIINIGKSRLFAFEHTNQVTGDPNVSLAFQHDYMLRVKYWYKPKIASEQIVEIP